MSGLEILGAIASSIALAQAVQGTLKAVDFLRQNSDMKGECNKLRKEILMIDCFIMQAREQTDPMMPAQRLLGSSEHPLVSLTIQELEEILEELNEIVEKYSRSRKVHNPKRYTDKVKWLSDAGKIEELRERAQATKSNLHMAITFRVSSMIDRGNVRQEVLFHRVTQQLTYYTQETHNLSQTLPKLLQGPQIMPESSVTSLQPWTQGTMFHNQPDPPATEENRTAEDSKMFSSNNAGHGLTNFREESFVSLSSVQPLGTRSCGSKCQCRCHRGRRDRTGVWAVSLFSSWLTRYDHTDDASSQSRCRCRSSAEFEFRLPRWLWAGVLSFQASRGPNISLSLRLSRVLESKDDLWVTMANPSLLEARIREGIVYFPDDTVGNEWPLLSMALYSESPDSVEILLKLWGNILPSQRLPRNIGYELKSYHTEGDRPETDMVIEKTLSFVQDWDEVSTTKVHKAAAGGGGVLDALREQPWAIDELNEYGQAPIHVAIEKNNLEGLEQLIAANADVNRQDAAGYTPLMLAADDANDTMLRKLLENSECKKCISQGNMQGLTALHLAAKSGSSACVRLLLEAGAPASKTDDYVRTPMHNLAWVSQEHQQEIHEIIKFLLDYGADIESKDNLGLTPILWACQKGNVPVLGALVRAGASLGAINLNRQGILHTVACSDNFDVVHYLAKQDLEEIDPQLRDLRVGDTPLGSLRWIFNKYFSNFHTIPSQEQQGDFIRFYFKLLIRNLERHMSTLRDIQEAIQDRDSEAARELLDTLIKRNEAGFRQGLAGWYRGLKFYVSDGQWDKLKEAICEEYDEISEKTERAVIAKEKTLADPEMKEFF
ncbi:endocytosis ankyrin repeat Nuc-2 [Fusarium subglutinans]|uniref:Endocytosis ankyrin repeat Nuc-2 n=1 Tax=Gibberella subglutinans TaxID=42677 RepID=A0A8H5Q2R7_GIBSU|nr:endocytosis ankyrin repeat Nuc-2 [Fusarium subglutinans]KAF5606548.1 endocytosis ankyrin repeat Nuc-2 [Fusarium subglutinans]